MVRKILEKVSEKQLQQDMERYRQRAIDLGATDAKVITTENVVIDERVLAKCTYPRCFNYGTSANCPPHAMSLDMMRKVVNNFQYAIFIKIEVPSELIAGKEAIDQKAIKSYKLKLAEIVAKLEAGAFYDGYHLALGFGSGACKPTFCPTEECQALIPGQSCRHHLKSRAAMEAVGMDVFTMAAKAGWDIYPIGESSSPSEIPYGLRLGLVLIY